MDPTSANMKRRPGSTGPSTSSDSPQQKKPRLDEPHLPFSDEEDNKLDKEVVEQVNNRVASFELVKPFPALILSKIVQTAHGRLNDEYISNDRADDLLKVDRELYSLVVAAWEKKKFASVRRMPVLQNPEISPNISSPPYQLDKTAHRKVIESAWNNPYEGPYHRLLYSNINKMDRTGPYTNSVAIIQSSGTGKSRMVHEQSNLVFTIPFNLREAADNKDLPFPPPDEKVREFLAHPSGEDVAAVRLHYVTFLLYTFQAVRDELGKLDPPRIDQPKSRKALAGRWRAHLEQGRVRESLYNAATDKAKAAHAGAGIVDSHPDNPQKYKDPFDVVEAAAKAELRKLLSEMDSLVDSPATTSDVKLMFYFDEASTLTRGKAPSNPDNKNLYDILCSCFNTFRTYPLFVIFLSTSSHIEALAPSGPLANSARARINADGLQAPITEVAFDCHKDFPIKSHQYTLQEVSDVAFMAKFGRPLFWAMLENAGESEDNMRVDIIPFARAKLTCHNKLDPSFNELTKEAVLATLDVRLNLGFNTSKQDTFKLESAQVASHMRMMFSVPQDRASFHSGYPSEPILAEAAAQQMYAFRQKRPSVVVDVLKDNMDNGLLDLGGRGELVARVLLTAAYDRAMEKDHPKGPQAPFYSKGCNLTTFLEELFRDKHAEIILGSHPDNVKSHTTLRDAFKDAKVRFTHFVKMADDTATTTEAMYAAFLRGMAIVCHSNQYMTVVCHSNQYMTDVMVPVLLWDEKLCEEVMTSICIQIKRRITAGTKQAYAIDDASLYLFPKPSESTSKSTNARANSRPYITLIMELGVQQSTPSLAMTHLSVMKPPPNVAKKPPPNVVKKPHLVGKAPSKPESGPSSKMREKTPSKVDVPTHGSRSGLRSRAEPEHPRYSIFAYGCSSTVYKVIEPGQKAQYAQLLASRSFLASHQRQTPDSLLAVRKLKPFWAAGPGCYHWLKSSLLNTEAPVGKPDDGWLEAGTFEA
ncbi:hypothetical protein JB92DRAFT_2897710 [Gautieria morchelliformis]|nr:hypothetical protein JB92DRAFT_2897710 [Gautieria morchelliformis]